MKGKFLLICILAVLVLVSCMAVLASSGKQEGASGEETVLAEDSFELSDQFLGGEGKKISLEFNAVSLVEALKMISGAAEVSYAIRGEIPVDLRVTAFLRNASPEAAFGLVCDSAGLACDYNPVTRTFVVFAPQTVDLSGVQVPVLGAVHAQGLSVRTAGGGTSGGARPFFGLPYGEDSVMREEMMRAGIPGVPFEEDGRLVSLEVKDAPFREAVQELAEQAGVDLVIEESVSKDLKVTATIRDVMFDEALFYLTSQANLVFSVMEEKEGKTVLRISPVPVLQVTVSGAEGQPRCPRCGYIIPSPNWKFCSQCGAPLSPAKAGIRAEGGGSSRSGGMPEGR
jgi:hypothetical protein